MRVLAPGHRTRQIEPLGITAKCRVLDGRTTRHRETQKLRRLVVGLAQRVVDRRRKPAIAPDILDQQQLRMPARDEKHQVGRPDAVGQTNGQRMRLEMIDREKRFPRRERQRLGRRRPDNETADKPRPRRRGNP